MNIRDVAELAGVSPATISRYINNSAQVSKKTAEKIEEILKLTDFKLKDKKHKVDFNYNNSIGVVVTSLSNPVYSEILTGIRKRAKHFGLSTIIIETNYCTEAEKQAVIDLFRQRVQGVILTLTQEKNSDVLNILKNFQVPYCLLHTSSLKDDPCVYIDNYQAGKDIAKKLYEIGHTSLGIVTPPSQHSHRVDLRYAGFKEFINKQKKDMYKIEFEDSEGSTLTKSSVELLFGENAPTALFCANDLLAIRVFDALRLLNIKIPEDISLVGFDGIKIAQLITGSLATIKVANVNMGIISVDILKNTKAGAKFANQMSIEYTLDLSGTVKQLVG